MLAAAAFVASPSRAQQSLPSIDVGAARARSQSPAASSRLRASPAPATGTASPVEKPARSAMPENIPAVVSAVTRQQIETSVNALTTAETLRYLPSIFVRERYVGDRAAPVSARTTATNTSGEVLVYADNVLLSNLLGNIAFPPRWNMVSPAEIERIDVTYGPFSALYPGNSHGGVVTITTRMPKKFELHASGVASLQNFTRYQTDELNLAGNMNIAVGNKINDFSFWLTYDRLDAQSQSTYFGTALPAARRGTPIPVCCGQFDLDPQGRPRLITGTFADDHTQQHLGKAKLVYEFAPSVRATYLAGLWSNVSDYHTTSYLRNAAGFPIYNAPGQVSVGPWNFSLIGLNPGHENATHLMQAFSIKRDTGDVFDFDVVGSSYNFLRDYSHFARSYGLSTAGSNTNNGGTYWHTLDGRAIWRPQFDLLGKHEVSFGAHADLYSLNTAQTNTNVFTSNFYNSIQAINYGKTQTQGIYVQDVWQLHPQWKLTAGARGDFWRAYGGLNNTLGRAANLFRDAYKQSFSPKGAIEYHVTDDFMLRGSIGRAYRFPTVNELFQNIAGPNSITTSNPNLQTEVFTAYDLTGEYSFRNVFGVIGFAKPRVSLFMTDRWNAIFNQVDFTTGIRAAQNSNIGKARFRGVEGAVEMNDAFLEGLDFYGSVTFVDAKILSNYQNPNFQGMQYPRVPPIRARAVASYRPNSDLSLSLGMRYASAAYGNLANDDFIRDTFGSASTAYLFIDAKANYKLSKEWTLSGGVDNIGNYKANAFHNLPHRMYFLGLKYDYVGETPRAFSDLNLIPGG